MIFFLDDQRANASYLHLGGTPARPRFTFSHVNPSPHQQDLPATHAGRVRLGIVREFARLRLHSRRPRRRLERPLGGRELFEQYSEGRLGKPGGLRRCAPSMGAVLRVQVPPRGGHLDRSEPQLRKGDRPWEGSGERNRGPMYKKRIGGGAERGERAMDREATMTKAQAT